MPLKHNWEKTNSYIKIPKEIVEGIVKKYFPNQEFCGYEIISGGCANLNIKLNFSDNSKPVILRIYIREIDAAYREQKITELVSNIIPVAKFYAVDDFENYRFACIEYIEGITLRDLLLHHKHEDATLALKQAGKLLAKFQQFTFSQAGFFDKDLNIKTPLQQNDFLYSAQDCLKTEIVIQQLGSAKIAKINNLLIKNTRFFPDNSQPAHLVHADYDPSNILVNKINEQWHIVAILDFEFAFAGSWLCDIANMLRYTHQMPVNYEKSFLDGIKSTGLILPSNWQISINLLNLLSLLQCLLASSQERPMQLKDIGELIDHIITNLEANQ